MNQRKSFFKYFKEYRWSNIFAMIRNSRAEPEICREEFHDRLVVITGATSGIGYFTARKYASHGARLLCINRNEKKSRALCEEIRAEYGVRCEYRIADLSLMDDIYRVARELIELPDSIDVFIHNAGIYNTRRELTIDGHEMVFFVNYLSSFVLTYLLKEKLNSQARARILLVNSEGHRFAAWGLRLDDLNWEKRWYSGMGSYGSAKTAQLLAMLLFSDYFEKSEVTINAMHPGAVKTEAGKYNGPLYKWFKREVLERNFQSPEISAEALYYLGVSKEMEGNRGKFFNLTTEEEPAPPALDREVAEELWDISLKLGGLYEQD
jgi:NAD(P)-dependent dehydrogenase (short-subunit alcohol dehydrogenase family)